MITRRQALQICAIGKLIDCAQYLIDLALLNQIRGPLIVESLVTAKDPKPRFLGGIEFGQTLDNEFKLQQLNETLALRPIAPGVPARHGLRSRAEQLRDIDRLDAAFLNRA